MHLTIKKILVSVFLCFIVAKTGSTSIPNLITPQFSIDNAMDLMKEIGVAHPDIVIAQARLETGNFTSRIFKENNNLFGMKLAKSRPTTALTEKNNHAVYKDWVQSVRDYKLWQDSVVSKHRTRRAYLKYIANNYAEDKQYINKLKQML